MKDTGYASTGAFWVFCGDWHSNLLYLRKVGLSKRETACNYLVLGPYCLGFFVVVLVLRPIIFSNIVLAADFESWLEIAGVLFTEQ
ncbi:hypothetical protein [Desulfosporosinus sp. BG]|uniref:hypothetical protein n=1 Tax=Desulfosporosinus sp. BG TaxID=1633135 RepID=UPI00083A43DC|nr:hypothetical protein [Desulfosporosinus sp. BG]